MKYGLKSNYDFDNKDIVMPDMVIRDIAIELNEITKGLVVANLCEYNGAIESHDTISALAALSRNLYAATRIDIQDNLGAIGDAFFKFELFLSSPYIENYKYRILFIGYSVGGYPVEVVVEQGIADELNRKEDSAYIYNVESKDEFENLIINIFNSKTLEKIIQQLITASGRKLQSLEEKKIED